MVHQVQLGRIEAGTAPVLVPLGLEHDGTQPQVQRSLWWHFFTPHITAAYPVILGSSANPLQQRLVEGTQLTLSKVPGNTQHAADAKLLMYDLHTGKRAPMGRDNPGVLIIDVMQGYTTHLYHFFDTYQVGILEITPGFSASFFVEKTGEKFRVVYEAMRGVYLTQTEQDASLQENHFVSPEKSGDLPIVLVHTRT